MTLWAGIIAHPDNVNTLRYKNLTKTEFGKGGSVAKVCV